MKKTLMALACALPIGIASADETSLPTVVGSTALVQMSETELDSVTGGWPGAGEACFCRNRAYVTQLNISIASLGVRQSNYSEIHQSNN